MKKSVIVLYEEKEFEVEFWHQPEENPDRGPEAQYPGCPAEIEILDIKNVILGTSFMFAFKLHNEIGLFEDLVWDELENQIN